VDRASAEGSKNRTTIKGLFKAAIKAITQRDDDAPQPQTRRRRGEKEGGGTIMVRLFARIAGRPAARGRYAALQGEAAAQHFAQSGHEAQAALYLSDTLDWLKLWHDNADHWPDDDFNAKQDRYFPQP
jgi:hypothetical protein